MHCVYWSQWPIIFLLLVNFRQVRLQNADERSVLAVTKSGIVRGQIHSGGNDQSSVAIFLGIPYAAPPTGDLRFAPPQPSPSWQNVRDAVSHSPQCPQRLPLYERTVAGLPTDEDCLYLDVYLPRWNNSSEMLGNGKDNKLPVILYIPGGAFSIGTAATHNFTMLALNGVLVVTMNYRVNVFGFLSTGDDVIPGNYGLLDQVMASDWVKMNIGAFGGNPNDVTIMGNSAGATCTGLHLLSPLSRGKFSKAIIISGSSIQPVNVRHEIQSLKSPLELAQTLADLLGCPIPRNNLTLTANDSSTANNSSTANDSSTAFLACLRSLPWEDVLDASVVMQSTPGIFLPWIPVVDKVFLPRRPIDMLRDGDFQRLPTMRGFTKDELSILLPVIPDAENGVSLQAFENLVAFYVANQVGRIDEAMISLILDFYLPEVDRHAIDPLTMRSRLMDFVKYGGMVSPMIQETLLMGVKDSYMFEFDYRSSFDPTAPYQGVVHGSAIPFFLGLPKGPDEFKFLNTNAEDERLASDMVTLVSNFVRFSNPTPTPLHGIDWPLFETKKDPKSSRIPPSCDSLFTRNSQYRYLSLTHPLGVKPFDDKFRKEVNFWSSDSLGFIN